MAEGRFARVPVSLFDEVCERRFRGDFGRDRLVKLSGHFRSVIPVALIGKRASTGYRSACFLLANTRFRTAVLIVVIDLVKRFIPIELIRSGPNPIFAFWAPKMGAGGTFCRCQKFRQEPKKCHQQAKKCHQEAKKFRQEASKYRQNACVYAFLLKKLWYVPQFSANFSKHQKNTIGFPLKRAFCGRGRR